MKLLSKLCTIFYLVKDPLAAIGRSIYRSGIGLTNIQCLQMCDQCKIIHFHFHDNDRDYDDENDNDSENDNDDDDDVTYISIPYLLWWGWGWWSRPGCTPPCTGRRRQTSSCLSWTSPANKQIIKHIVTIIISITFRPFLAALPCTVTLGFFFRQNLQSHQMK